MVVIRIRNNSDAVDSVKARYDKIKKVYSIWICMDADDDGESISRISLKPDTLFGRHCDFPKLDKMCGMVIRIRNNSDVAESRNRLIAMLEDVLSREDSDVSWDRGQTPCPTKSILPENIPGIYFSLDVIEA